MLRQIAILLIILCLSMAAKAQDDEEEDFSEPVVDSLLCEYAAATSDTARLRLCMEIGKVSGSPDTVIKYSNIGISLFDGKDSSKLVSCYGDLAWGYDVTGQDMLAIDCYKKVLKICKAIGDVKNYVFHSINLSGRYGEVFDFRNQWLTLYDALKMAQQNSDTANMSYCYFTLAYSYSNIGMKQQGIETATKAFQLAKQSKNYKEMAADATLLSSLYNDYEYDRASFGMAIQWAYCALGCFDKAGDLNCVYDGVQNDAYLQLAYSYSELAEIEGKSYLVDSAAYFIDEARAYYERNGNLNYAYVILLKSGNAHVKCARKDYNGALKLYNEAIQLAGDVDFTYYYNFLYQDLSRTYLNLGDHRNALKYYELYMNEKEQSSGMQAVMEAAAFEIKSQVEQEQELAEAEQRIAEEELADKHSHFVRMMIVSAAGIVALLVFVFFVLRMLQEARKGNAALVLHNEEILTQNEAIAAEKAAIEEINDKIRQSMSYARRIQMATVSSEDEIGEVFPNALVYNRPCEIVSGDWYWTARLGSKKILALGGSAKHGVPGALVSMMTVNALKDTVGQLSAMSMVSPSAILRTVQSKLPESARINAAGLSLCVFGRGRVRFAGVNQNAVLLKNGGSVIMHGDEPGDIIMGVAEGDTVVLYSASTKRELLNRDIKPDEFCDMFAQQSPDARKGIIEELVVQKEQREDVTVVSITI